MNLLILSACYHLLISTENSLQSTAEAPVDLMEPDAKLKDLRTSYKSKSIEVHPAVVKTFHSKLQRSNSWVDRGASPKKAGFLF